MAFKSDGLDNIRETFSLTTPSAVVSLSGAAGTSRPFSSELASADTFWGTIRNQGEYMTGVLRWTSGTPATITQIEVWRSSNSNAIVTFSAGGTGEVFADPPSRLFDHLNMTEITVASAATTNIGAVDGKFIELTGTTGITSFGTAKNKERAVRYTGGGLTITHSATLVCPGAVNLTLNTGDTFTVKSDNTATPIWRISNYQSGLYAPYAGKLIKVTIFTASGTWTKPAGCRTVVVEVVGGGASAGGCGATGAATAAASGGGGGGGYALERITSPGATETFTVGPGGAAPTAGNNPGNAGGTSSFGSHCSATGGAAGGGSLPLANPGTVGGAGGVGSGGDVNLQGSSGAPGMGAVGGYAIGGAGGAAARGSAGPPGTNVGGLGGTGSGYGAGGAGSSLNINTAAVSGGAGAAGAVIVWEYE